MKDDLPENDGSNENDRQFVTSLARGLEIISCFGTEARYLSNNEISNRTGLARPTVSRLTHTLTKTGHLERGASSGEYRLSAKVLQLGFSVLSAMNVRDRYIDDMIRLCEGPNPYVTIALAERSGTRAVYLAVRRSQQAVSLSLDVGSRLPLFYSGVGRAIIAGVSQDERAEILRLGVAEFPAQKDRIQQSVYDAVRDFEAFGYCTSFGAWKPEINSIAAPLRSLDGTSMYSVNVGGPSFLVSPEELHEKYGGRLLKVVADLGNA